MKIDRIVLTHVRVPLTEPFRISSGSVSEKDAIIVSVMADGLAGCGEASPMAGSFYSSETPDSTFERLCDRLVPGVLAAQPDSIADIVSLLDRVGGDPFARAGMETAFWDLEAQRRGVPLRQLLGGTRQSVSSGFAAGIYSSTDRLLSAIERYLVDGYVRVKIKIQPGWDLIPLTEVRKRFGNIDLMVDANCAYTTADIPHLKNLDQFGLVMVEQPLQKEDLRGHAALQRELKTPVCLDESAADLSSVQAAIDLGACRIINIKIQRVGGLQHALEINSLCAAARVPVWAGTMPELGIGGAQAIHLATLENFSYPTDVEASSRWFEDDIVEPLIEVRGGACAIPDGPGLGYRPSQGKLRKYRLRERTFEGMTHVP